MGVSTATGDAREKLRVYIKPTGRTVVKAGLPVRRRVYVGVHQRIMVRMRESTANGMDEGESCRKSRAKTKAQDEG